MPRTPKKTTDKAPPPRKHALRGKTSIDASEPEKKKALQKKVANPVSTGGRGSSFERRVQAMRLLAMCLGIPCAGVREHFEITSLLFQGRVMGHNTDDLVVFTTRHGADQKARHNLQMKRSLKATENDTFTEAVGLAWLDFKRAEFTTGLDENLIVYDAHSSSSMKGAVEVVNSALASSDGETWFTRVHAVGFSNSSNRAAYSAIKSAADKYNGQSVASSELHQFVLHLRFLAHDMDSERAPDVSIQQQLINQALPWRDASALWAQLMAACAELNGVAGEVSLSTVGRYIGDLAEEFQAARALHTIIAGAQAGALVISPEMHKRLKPLAEILHPLLSDRGLVSSAPAASLDLPASQESSANSIFSRQLDRVKLLHSQRQYREALAQLETLQEDMDSFDSHQKARWYFLRGMCYWHLADDGLAASDLEKAYALHNEDDRIAAGSVRAYLLRDQVQAALEVGQALIKRFPDSFPIWQIVTNARVMNQEKISEEDIPEAFREKSGAWQMLASSLASANDDEGAIQAIKMAMKQSDSSIFILENYLRMTLRLATQNNIHVQTRWQPQDRRARLIDAISAFDDRENVLWSEQSIRVKTDIVFHLAYSYLLLAKPSQALEMIEQGRQRGVPNNEETFRVELDALIDLNRQDEAVARFSERIESLPTDALVSFGQACLSMKRDDLIQAAMEEVSLRVTSCATAQGELVQQVDRILLHMHWESLLRENLPELVREELAKMGVTPGSSSIPHLVFAARAYVNDLKVRKSYEGRVAELAPKISAPQDLAIASQLMLSSGRFDAATEILERLLPIDVFTPLHVDLIYSYAALDHRAKLRDLLQSLPEEWRMSSDARQAAMHLYGNAGDWLKMHELADQAVVESPNSAAAWLLLIQVTANVSSDKTKECVANVPDLLEGSTADLLRLGSIEVTYGDFDKGMERIYRAMRCNAGELEAAALHMTLMIMANEASEKVQRSPEVVGPATSVELQDADGNSGYVTIDVDTKSPLPGAAEFVSPNSREASALMGLKVGDTASFPSAIGKQNLVVARIITAHHRLFELSNQRVTSSVIPSEVLTSMSIPHDSNGEIDMSFFIEKLEQREAHGLNMLSLYQQHAATLGLIARMIGVDLIDLVRDWPTDGQLLEATFERGVPDKSSDVFAASASWAVDLSMLVELATLGLLDVLEHFPKVYVSSATKLAVTAKIEKTSRYRPGGSMFSHDEKIGIQERTKEHWDLERAFLESIELAIDSYCEVVPAYGLASSNQLPMLKDILADEEYSTLLVCLEYSAGLLSLDGRLRLLAQTMEIRSASPQMLLIKVVQDGQLSRLEYSRALLKMIIARRSFIGIDANDLVAMMDQGPVFATLGINSLRSYLATPLVIFSSATPVITDFISQMYNSCRCDIGVMLELIDYCFEALFRHPQCPSDWDAQGYDLMLMKFAQSNVQGLIENAIRIKIGIAKARASRPIKSISFTFEIIYGQRVPYYMTTEPTALTAELTQSSIAAPLLPLDGEGTKASADVE